MMTPAYIKMYKSYIYNNNANIKAVKIYAIQHYMTIHVRLSFTSYIVFFFIILLSNIKL